MHDIAFSTLIVDLLIVIAVGLISGIVCKRLGISLLVGYLVVGAIIGEGGFQLVTQEHHELEYLARAGALLLLFSVGIEFSLEELLRLSRYFLIGGTVQMLQVAAVLGVACLLLGMDWRASLLLAGAAALSSTVLVFKSLAEWGHVSSPHGRRAIGILLFQDVALVPLMLLVPLLTGEDKAPSLMVFVWLAGKSLLFVVAVILVRFVIGRLFVPLFTQLRSVELIVLFSLAVLGGACFGSYALGLPPAIGALAAGLMLSGNRLSKQIDTLILPYRESFSAVFFVTLGTLLHPMAFLEEPVLLTVALIGVLVVKTAAAAVALRLIGLNWRAAFGMGLGLAQLGEFSFLLIAEGLGQKVIEPADYNRLLFIALGTLILTPQLLKFGLKWASGTEIEERAAIKPRAGEPIQRAIVIGIGPIGRQITSRLEILGVDVCLVDLSPVNLYAFGQQGFQTVAGDARDPEVLRRADAAHCRLAVVCVPDDDSASQVVRSLRELNRTMSIIVRCRYLTNVAAAKNAGATEVVSEEAEASGALLTLCVRTVRQSSQIEPETG